MNSRPEYITIRPKYIKVRIYDLGIEGGAAIVAAVAANIP